MIKLSVVISAFNEERLIEDCLRSVQDFSSEIVFVDNTSQDRTVEIARKYTGRIFVRPNDPVNLNKNKNFGFGKAKNPWILSLDADERVTKPLASEILEVIKKSSFDGYYIPRRNIIFGRWIKHTGWYPDYQLRLFKKEKGRFLERHVHEMLEVYGQVGYLKRDLWHENYSSISQFIQKLDRTYSVNEAQALLKSGKKLHWFDAIRMPSEEFISRYFAREGYKDGFYGLFLSLLMAFYHLVVFAKAWEMKKFANLSDPTLNEIEQELKKWQKDTTFWLINEKLKRIKSPWIRKFSHLLKRLGL